MQLRHHSPKSLIAAVRPQEFSTNTEVVAKSTQSPHSRHAKCFERQGNICLICYCTIHAVDLVKFCRDNESKEQADKHIERRERQLSDNDTILTVARRLVDLLDRGALLWRGARSTTGEATGSTAREAAWCAAGTRVQLLHDRVGDALELLLLLLVLLLRRLLRVVEPLDGLVNRGLELGLVLSRELVAGRGVGQGVAEVVRVRLEAVLRGDTSSGSLILS